MLFGAPFIAYSWIYILDGSRASYLKKDIRKADKANQVEKYVLIAMGLI